jgi:hypothetical protein
MTISQQHPGVARRIRVHRWVWRYGFLVMSVAFTSQPIFVNTNTHLYLFQIMLKLGWV